MSFKVQITYMAWKYHMIYLVCENATLSAQTRGVTYVCSFKRILTDLVSSHCEMPQCNFGIPLLHRVMHGSPSMIIRRDRVSSR
jgi:hypothetical protein